jgi:DNA-binding SARP family transcriptional activator
MPPTPRASTSPVRFRVLGTLEFFDGQGWVSIGAAKQRALLAALLLSPNQVVPVERLVAELWTNTPPASVNGLLVGYVWRLRRVMRDTAGTVLVTRPPGYLLAVPDGTLDVHGYEALTAAGRAALAAEDVAGAAAMFTEALALWRGVPFADVAPTPAVMAEAARLEESRLAITEAWMGAEVQLGRHDALLPELKQLVSQHPLRERLHAHLMLTLYRAGQQAEALGAYHDLRRLLVNELGIEPSRPLRDLQQQILREDPELLRTADPLPARAAPAAVMSPAVAPRQLPPDAELFVDRDAELAAITERLAGGGVCALYGAAGTGTSTLALRAAHALAGRFPDGQLRLDLRGSSTEGPLRPAEVANALLSAFGGAAFGGSTFGGADPAAGWAAAVAGRRVLVLLDDVADAGQVRWLLSPPPGSAVLLTGRAPLEVAGPQRLVRLRPLPLAAAVDLLRRSLAPGRVDAEKAAAAEVARLCGYLPLALGIAANWLARRPEWTLADWAGRLADPRRRLDLLATEEHSVRGSLQATLRLAERAGDPAVPAALHLLGALDLPVVGTGTVAALLDRTEPAAQLVAARLVDLGLVETVDIDRYRVPDLVRLFAREQQAGAVDAPAAVRRVVDQHVELVRARLAGLGADRGATGAGLAWYRRERGALRSLADRDHTDALHKAVDELAWALSGGPSRP